MSKPTNTVIYAAAMVFSICVAYTAGMNMDKSQAEAAQKQFSAQTSDLSLAQKSEQVYETCNQSRVSPTVSEEACGALQDAYGIEFLCKDHNSEPQTVCWTEVKE